MKMLADYVENAIKFAKMAAREGDPTVKAQYEAHAAAYRKLAEYRAKKYGLQMPTHNGSETLQIPAMSRRSNSVERSGLVRTHSNDPSFQRRASSSGQSAILRTGRNSNR